MPAKHRPRRRRLTVEELNEEAAAIRAEWADVHRQLRLRALRRILALAEALASKKAKAG